MKLVLDASMALAWLFNRSDEKERVCADKVLLSSSHVDAYIPSLWHIEITNALLVGKRRKVVTEAQVIDYIHKLSQLPIITDDVSIMSRRDVVMGLAHQYDLSTYDASYLDLALRLQAALATFDVQLANAMRRAGGVVFESIELATQ